jgi:hypothetical protein
MIGGNIQTASEVKEFILFQTDVLQQKFRGIIYIMVRKIRNFNNPRKLHYH